MEFLQREAHILSVEQHKPILSYVYSKLAEENIGKLIFTSNILSKPVINVEKPVSTKPDQYM